MIVITPDCSKTWRFCCVWYR